jgi:hypothetical protein
MDNNAGSRHIALQECEAAGPGTVGAVIAAILKSKALAWMVKYEIASAGIGTFYQRQDIRVILRSSWTDANLHTLSVHETEFYRTQPGSAGVVGRLLGADERYFALRMARDHMF